MNAGALGAELVLSGRLPGARAKSWRFAQGYLKKTGESSKVVDRAKAIAQTKPGTVGVKVSILTPYAELKDKIKIEEKMLEKLEENSKELNKVEKLENKTKKSKNKSEKKK
jgi:small subunit ribosomal protein S3